jgi:hypothetical protein
MSIIFLQVYSLLCDSFYSSLHLHLCAALFLSVTFAMAALSLEEVAKLRAGDDDTLRVPLIVGHAVCLFVAVVSVSLRFWARRLGKTFMGADDWVNAAGLVIA